MTMKPARPAAPDSPAADPWDGPQPARRIENNTDGNVVLKPTTSFPYGVTVPASSITTVPGLYFEELFATVREKKDIRGVVERRYPGREHLKAWLEPVPHHTSRSYNPVIGARLTMYEPAQAPDRPDGPNWPDSIDTLPDDAAAKMIAICTDKKKLALWAAGRSKLAGDARTRLAGLQ